MMRNLFKLPSRTHNYIVCVIVECISTELDRRLAKIVYSMLNSRNLDVFLNLYICFYKMIRQLLLKRYDI